jgi:transposase
MSNMFWLTEAQMARLQPFFPKSHGKPRVDDLRVLSGISSSIAMACGGAIRPRSMACRRPSTIGGSDGATRASSPG